MSEQGDQPVDLPQDQDEAEGDEAARLRAEEEEAARLKEAEEARLRAEAEEAARLKEAEEARLRAEAEEAARLKEAEEERLRAEAAEAERAKAAEDARLRAESQMSQKTESTPEASELLAAAEQRLRELLPQVQDMSVLKELSQLADSDALEKLVNKGKPPPRASFAARGSLKGRWEEAATKPQSSKEGATERAKNLGTVSTASIAVGGAGQGGGLGLNKPGFGPKVQNFAGGGRGSVSQKSIEINADVKTSWQEVQDDNAPASWVIITYTADGKTLELKGKGEGGLSEFKDKLPEDSVAWGGFRCYGVDKRGGLECKRPKFVFVQHKPEAISAIKKAKQGSHKGDVKGALDGAHLDVVVEKMEDLSEETLIEKLQAATGAHKPNGYEFDPGKFVEADYYGLGIGKSCKGETTIN